MVNLSFRGRKLTRGQLLAAATGLATVGLLGLQLTSDVPNNGNNYIEQDADYDTLRRQLKVELEMEERYSDEMPKHLRNLRDMREVCSSVYDPSRGLYGCINITDPTASPTPAPSSAPIDNETAYLLSLVPADNCEMQAVLGPGEIPTDVDYINTIIVGYPGADKRIVLRQAEALTGLSGRDSWDMKFLGITRQPYIKTNYPHHEGIWGWHDHADQVVFVVRGPRHTIDEYHDILADIDYAKTWEAATEKIPMMYKGTIYEVLYNGWRDERTMDEIGWYGWLIDYWMEGGLYRDYFDNKLTTQEHWRRLRAPELWTYGELQYDYNICTGEVDGAGNPYGPYGPVDKLYYDQMCDQNVPNSEWPDIDAPMTADCRVKLLLSAERFMANETGHAEHRKLATLLNETQGVQDTLVNDTYIDCLYDTIITNNPTGKGDIGDAEDYTDMRAREGYADRRHKLSYRHLKKMNAMLNRLIVKYSSSEGVEQILNDDPFQDTNWAANPVAQYLVELLIEYRDDISEELFTLEDVKGQECVVDENGVGDWCCDAKEKNPNDPCLPFEDHWAHAPKVNWYIFPQCGPLEEIGNATHSEQRVTPRRVWDYDYRDWLGDNYTYSVNYKNGEVREHTIDGWSGYVWEMAFD